MQKMGRGLHRKYIFIYFCIYYIYNKCLGLWPMQTSVGYLLTEAKPNRIPPTIPHPPSEAAPPEL